MAHEIIEREKGRGLSIVTLEGDTLNSNGQFHTVPKDCYKYQPSFLTEAKRMDSRSEEEEQRRLAREVESLEEQFIQRQHSLINVQREASKLKERLPQESELLRLEHVMKNLRHKREMLERERERVRERIPENVLDEFRAKL